MLPLVSTYSLALWCLQGKQNGDGYGFPFDRPLLEFSRRLLILTEYLPDLIRCLPAEDRIGNRIFYKLVRQVVAIVQDPVFEPAVEELRWRCLLFDDLREKMRIALPGSGKGLNDEGSTKDMGSIEQGVNQFRKRLENNKFADDPLCLKVAKQIDRYGDKLFADPIEINTSTGPATIYPQRTNNILEQFFRRQRREYRRRTGNNSMRKRLQTMLAETPLVKNLSNPDYMGILLDGKSSLEELFASIEMNGEKCDIEPLPDTEKLLPGFRRLSNLLSLPEQIVQIATQSN